MRLSDRANTRHASRAHQVNLGDRMCSIRPFDAIETCAGALRYWMHRGSLLFGTWLALLRLWRVGRSNYTGFAAT